MHPCQMRPCSTLVNLFYQYQLAICVRYNRTDMCMFSARRIWLDPSSQRCTQLDASRLEMPPGGCIQERRIYRDASTQTRPWMHLSIPLCKGLIEFCQNTEFTNKKSKTKKKNIDKKKYKSSNKQQIKKKN